MQGDRGTIGSMPETLEFDRGSTSSDATVDQQVYWANLQIPGENETPESLLSPGDINTSSVNSVSHEWQNSRGWSLGEPSSSNTASRINNNEQIRETGWSSSVSVGGLADPRLEERCLEPTNAVSLDNVNTASMHIRSSNSHSTFQNPNFSAGLVDSSIDNNQQSEHTHLHKSSGPVSECIPPDVGSGSSLLPSENCGLLVEETTRRVSCKRKVVDGNVGQPSDGGSCSYTQHTDGSAWRILPAQDNSGSNLSRYVSSEQINSRLGLGMGNEASNSASDSNVVGSSVSLHRNFRLRINHSNEQSSVPPTAFSTGSVIRHSSVSSSTPVPQSIHPVNSSLNLRSAPPLNLITPSQPPVVHGPPPSRNRQSVRWSSSTSSRIVRPSHSIIPANSDNLHHQEVRSRPISSNILEEHNLEPSNNLRSSVQDPIFRASSSSNLSILGNVASSFQTESNSATNPSSASTWASRPNHPQYPRRLPEYVRRSLLSPGSDVTGSPSNNHSSLCSGPSASESRALSSGAHPRSSSWLERQGDSGFAIPYSLRTLAGASEGSSRFVSEVQLRNVLGLMRRGGGNLRFEDVLILDQSVFSGIADIHDRHRNMRLDVDNMSYEELLALEERIGNVSTGLSEESILKLLKQKKYSVETGPQLDAEPCCVCQEDYGEDDDVGTLDCGHDFHSHCIKQWLIQKNLCPICKTTGLAT